MATKVADWPGTKVVLEPEQLPEGELSELQVGPLVSAPAGAVWVSVMPTELKVTLPVLVATNW